MKKITSALISVYYKDNLDVLATALHEQGVKIYSTGGTRDFIEKLNIPVVPVEDVTGYPSILGGRVKTLHPGVFGGILARRDNPQDMQEVQDYNIPLYDLTVVDLYPFEETVKNTTDEQTIIEKIDIGGISLIRAAAKNFKDTLIVCDKNDFLSVADTLRRQDGAFSLEQRRAYASKAFHVSSHYDGLIFNYFDQGATAYKVSVTGKTSLRYGENPHQQGNFYGDISALFEQLNGKELSYNNLVDVDAAWQLIREFDTTTFAIIKHTNVCGIAAKDTVKASWDAALAGDPESAFGGVLACNGIIDRATAEAISEIFFEVLMAPAFDDEALEILRSKKNRILLQMKPSEAPAVQYKSLLNGVLAQDTDNDNYATWNESGGRDTTAAERTDLVFANIICKHLKSNAIALVKDQQLVGKGCGQTSRIDALRHAIEKAKHFHFSLQGAVLASDAFFPFDDCVKMAHEEGISAFIQPGGSIRDKDSIAYCQANNLAMAITGTRHFKH